VNETRRDPARAAASKLPRILVVEDEADLALLLSYNLEAEGYAAETVERGDEAELRLVEAPPDLVILDWMLPGVSGLEICRRLRARETTRTLPVIMLTARGEETERVRGLSVGADDYVVKPFSVPELMARVRALLRRSRPERIADRLVAGDIDLDRETRRVRRGARDLHLGPTEFRLLEYLLERPGRVFSRGQLLDGRRPCRAPAQGAVSRAGTRPDPHGARRGLCVRRDLREGLNSLRRGPWLKRARTPALRTASVLAPTA
jgi:two-component system phosphate regulon response regulator PhoB